MADQDQLPLQGAVLCCTSIPPERRSTLAEYATEMGAVHRLDLTSDVTHLLVGSIETAKYKYVAKERPDIKVLLPEWVEAVRDAWVQAESFDLEELEQQWKVPTLYGLTICVTGFDDATQRNELQQVIAANGAKYSGDLTKSVSHLIAKEPTGKKYEFAGQWRIIIVSLDWLRDSLDRGLALEELTYHPLVPREDRGRDAQVQAAKPKSPRTLKRARETSQLVRAESGARKLRRTASTRLGSQHGDLWADMGNAAGGVHQTVAGKEPEPAQLPLNESSYSTSEYNSANEQPMQQDPSTRTQSGDIFEGIRVFVSNFDRRKTDILQNHLRNGGATLVSQSDLRRRASVHGNLRSLSCMMPVAEQVIIILPHDLAGAIDMISEMRRQSYISPRDTFCTDLWVEKCIFRKAVLDLASPLCQNFAFPIAGFENLTVCPTSFTGIDLLHLSKAVPLVGATYDETLRPSTSVLVCASSNPNPDKLRYALLHEIPVVEAAWFYTSIAASQVQPFDQFAPQALRNLQRPSSAKSEAHNPRRPPPGGHSGHDSSDQRDNGSQPASKREQDRTNKPKRPTQASHPDPSNKTVLKTSHVLREISPNSSPPKPQSRSPSKQASVSPTKAKQQQSDQTKVALSDALAQLLASRKERSTEQASASSIHATTAATGGPAPPLRHRKLGRATSNPSSIGSRGPLTSADALLESYDSALVGDENDNRTQTQAFFRPSQAVSYEDPEALAAREKLMKRMGGDRAGAGEAADEGGGMKVVARIGTVSREAESAAAAVAGGARKRLRKR